MKYSLKQVAPSVFLVTFAKAYDVAMVFLRYQEYYESPKFRGKLFTFIEYMEWYAANAGKGAFTYPGEYVGFNIPSSVVRKVSMALYTDRYDFITVYDTTMREIHNEILTKYGKTNEPYYLIGTSKEKGDLSTIDHEIAHGLYSTNHAYQEAADALTAVLPSALHKKLYKALAAREYHKSVWPDELQAYMATGIRDTMKHPGIEKHRVAYKKLYKAYHR